MKKFSKDVSVIFPAYNEEDNIELCVTRAQDALKVMLKSFEIIIVNDGSVDSTGRISKMLQDKYSNIKVVSKKKNEGYGYAIRDGIKSATCDLVFFSDSDMQFDIRNLENLLEHADNHDIVVGYRKKRLDPLKRKFFSTGYNTLVRILFGISFKDINCAFKLFHRRIFDKIKIESQNYVVNAEILTKARILGFTVKEVGVSHFPRNKGKSKIKFNDTQKTIKEVIKLYRAIK